MVTPINKLQTDQSGLVSPNASACTDSSKQSSVDKTRAEIENFWQEINELQRTTKQINMTVVAYWLQLAEESLEHQPAQVARARRYLLTARYWLGLAEEGASWYKWGTTALLIGLVYLIGIPVGVSTYCRYAQGHTPLAEFCTSLGNSHWTLGSVLVWAFIWGFAGGVIWCMYTGAFWTTRRLFDKNYLIWHIVHPWVCAVLGMAVCLLIYAGLAGLTTSATSAASSTKPAESLVATIAVVSFVTGFSTKYFWRLLDRNVRRLFGEGQGGRDLIERISDELPRQLVMQEEDRRT